MVEGEVFLKSEYVMWTDFEYVLNLYDMRTRKCRFTLLFPWAN